MSPRTPLAKIATAALAGSLAFGGGVALAALDGAEEPEEPSHGQVVSDVARATESGPGKGQIVSEVARLNVGETDDDLADDLPETGDVTKLDEEAGDTDDTDGSDDTDGVTRQHPANHGQVVSNVARTTPPGPGHGKAVSAVARGTHGPSVGDGDETDDAEDASSARGGPSGKGGKGGKGR